MEPKNASLIVCHKKGDCRVLQNMEGSRSQYFSSSRETEYSVKVVPASDELLRREVSKLGLVIDHMPTIKIVAEKFYSELISIKGGKLAWDEDTNKGFFEIVSYEMPNWQRLDQKSKVVGKTNQLLKKAKVLKEDVGKIFYTDPEETEGWIVTNEDFLKIDADNVGGWARISEFDVNV